MCKKKQDLQTATRSLNPSDKNTNTKMFPSNITLKSPSEFEDALATNGIDLINEIRLEFAREARRETDGFPITTIDARLPSPITGDLTSFKGETERNGEVETANAAIFLLQALLRDRGNPEKEGRKRK